MIGGRRSAVHHPATEENESTMPQGPPRTSASASPRARPGSSERALTERYDTALLDLDGVVYVGGEAVPHAVRALEDARGAGMRLAYVTNNARRTPQDVAAHLTDIGVPAGPADVITSAQAVARLIAEQVPPAARVLTVGGEGLREALRERGLFPVDSADDGPAAVVQGYGGPRMTWGQLQEAALAVERGAPWFASNADRTIPGGRGVLPGNGAALDVVRAVTSRLRRPPEPQIAGKPKPPLHRETIERTGAERPLVVGDRLDTDIEGAHGGGVDSLLVLTGVTDAAQLLAAPPEHRPVYVAGDLRGLTLPQPEVTRVAAGGGTGGTDGTGGTFGTAYECAGWRAEAAGNARRGEARDGAGESDAGASLVLDGSGEPLDGLRALCAAAWTAAGEGTCGLEADAALARLGW